MRIIISFIACIFLSFLSIPTVLAETLSFNAKKLVGDADNNSKNRAVAYQLEESSFELSASKKVKTAGVNEIMVYPQGYEGYDGPEEDGPANLLPHLTLAKNLRFDTQNVYRSEDSSIIVLQVIKGKDLQWLFIAQDNVRELARLPANVVSYTNNRIQLSKEAPSSLKKAIAAIVPQPEWKKTIWDQHKYKIYSASDILSGWSASSAPAGSDANAVKLLRELFTAKKQPIDGKSLLGDWRVRSLQANADGMYLYTFFKANIRADAAGIIFEKTSGSQRRIGRLYKDNVANQFIFLGGSYVNDDKPVGYSAGWTKVSAAQPKEADSAGIFQQISNKRAIMILDSESSEEFEIYELVR